MVDPIGEILVGVGEALARDSEALNSKKQTKSVFIRMLYYIIPMSIIIGFYIWKVS